jgi:two-component system response regulator FlrC
LPLAGSLSKIGRDLKRPGLTLAPDAEQKLVGAAWPGNVRELANALERAAILADGSMVLAEHLWVEAAGSPSAPAATSAGPKALVDLEREAIATALVAVSGNRRRAAELLGIGTGMTSLRYG